MRVRKWVAVAAMFGLSTSARALFAADEVASSPLVVPGTAYFGTEGMAVDADGNRYIVGAFRSPRDFNPGVGADERTPVGGADVFVSRYEADGSYAWTQTFGGSTEDAPTALTIVGSTVYLTGYFSSPDAGVGGPGAIAASGFQSAFILALDKTSGAPRTAFGRGGVEIFGTRYAVAADIKAAGNTLYQTGSFVDGSGFKGFVRALDGETGRPLGAFGTDGLQTFGGQGLAFPWAMAVSDTAVYVVGNLYGSNMGIGGAGSASNLSLEAYDSDVFVFALDLATGAGLTSFGQDGVQTFAGSGRELGLGIAVAGSSVYVVGAFSSSDAGVGGLGTTSARYYDAFVLNLDASSGAPNPLFGTAGVQTFTGSSFEVAYGVAADTTGVYVVGSFYGADAGIGGLGNISSSPVSEDAFVLALDPVTGAALASFSTDGVETFGGSGYDHAKDVLVARDRVWVLGDFDSSDAGVGGTGTVSAGTFGGFLVGFPAAGAP